MSKKKKVLLIIIIVLLLAAGGLVVYKYFFQKDEVIVKETKSLDSIKGFDYKLEDRDTKLYKEEFDTLKKNLEGDEIDYEAYAESVAKMFIIDLYTIDNKINKYDVGSLEFVHPDALENYKLNVEDTLYKYVADNTSLDRDQELPEVASIEVTDFQEDTFELNDEEVDCYVVQLSFSYVEDLGYDDNAKVIIVRQDDKLYVVQKSEIDDLEE